MDEVEVDDNDDVLDFEVDDEEDPYAYTREHMEKSSRAHLEQINTERRERDNQWNEMVQRLEAKAEAAALAAPPPAPAELPSRRTRRLRPETPSPPPSPKATYNLQSPRPPKRPLVDYDSDSSHLTESPPRKKPFTSPVASEYAPSATSLIAPPSSPSDFLYQNSPDDDVDMQLTVLPSVDRTIEYAPELPPWPFEPIVCEDTQTSVPMPETRLNSREGWQLILKHALGEVDRAAVENLLREQYSTDDLSYWEPILGRIRVFEKSKAGTDSASLLQEIRDHISTAASSNIAAAPTSLHPHVPSSA